MNNIKNNNPWGHKLDRVHKGRQIHTAVASISRNLRTAIAIRAPVVANTVKLAIVAAYPQREVLALRIRRTFGATICKTVRSSVPQVPLMLLSRAWDIAQRGFPSFQQLEVAWAKGDKASEFRGIAMGMLCVCGGVCFGTSLKYHFCDLLFIFGAILQCVLYICRNSHSPVISCALNHRLKGDHMDQK